MKRKTLQSCEHGRNSEIHITPYPADQMRMWEISPRVNSPKNDDPSCGSLKQYVVDYLFQRLELTTDDCGSIFFL